MIQLLARLLIPRSEETSEPEVRRAYGVLCGGAGIFLNILLFCGKFTVGVISHSIAVTADAFNNLSDAGSSLITMVGFQMAGHKPDPEHPFGHGRLEYISGFIVSIIILLMAVELLKSSFDKVLHPEQTLFTPVSFIVLLCSILIKLYMAFYNRRIGRKIGSTAMAANAWDSLSDALATGVVLLAALFGHYTGLLIDGWCGIAVALFILYAGYRAAKDTISPLLGQPPEPAFVEHVQELVLSYPDILGIHDLIVHNYGPERTMISLHAEVPATGNMLALHDTIDSIEKHLAKELRCQAVIHMDPVLTQDKETKEYRALIERIIKEVDPVLAIHDFRIARKQAHTNLIFDLVVPFGYALSGDELCSRICQRVQAENPDLCPVIEIDTGFDPPQCGN